MPHASKRKHQLDLRKIMANCLWSEIFPLLVTRAKMLGHVCGTQTQLSVWWDLDSGESRPLSMPVGDYMVRLAEVRRLTHYGRHHSLGWEPDSTEDSELRPSIPSVSQVGIQAPAAIPSPPPWGHIFKPGPKWILTKLPPLSWYF